MTRFIGPLRRELMQTTRNFRVWETNEPDRVWFTLLSYWTFEVYGKESFPRWYWDALTDGEKETFRMAFFERARKTNEPSEQLSGVADEAAKRQYPTLVEVLTTMMEGQFGVTGRCSLSIFVQDGVWKGIVRDKQEGLCLWVSSATLSQLFKTIEGSLLDPDTVWRLDRYAGNDQAKRKKK